MLLSLENLPKARQNEKREKEVRWNLSKKNGWERYKQLTEANSDKIANLVQDDELDIERLMTKIEGIENKIKFKAFGKTSFKMKAVEKQKDNRKENPSAGPKCPVRASGVWQRQASCHLDQLKVLLGSLMWPRT